MRDIIWVRIVAPFVLSFALIASGLGLAVSPAHAAVIKCRTEGTYIALHGTTTARIVSLNGTGTKSKVHSYKFKAKSWVTYDKRTNNGQGYGPSLTLIGRATQVQGWQAGTPCSPGTVRVVL